MGAFIEHMILEQFIWETCPIATIDALEHHA